MTTAVETTRRFCVADDTMRQAQRTMHAHYVLHEAAFAAFNPEFAGDFGAQWLAALDAADAATTHRVRLGQQQEDTAAVHAALDQARQALQELFYFVGRAFPNSAGHLDSYGRRAYGAARRQPAKMGALLHMAHTAATRDAAALAAKGYGAGQLAALGALAEALPAAATARAIRQGTHAEDSARYVALHNAAYAFGQAVSAAAKVLFAGARATLRLFRLGGHAAAPAEGHALTAPANGHKATTFATPLQPDTRLRLRLPTPKKGQEVTIYRVSDPEAPRTGGLTLRADQRRLDVLAGELGPAGQWLVVASGGPYPVRVALAVRS